ncbi:hypothetical protein [Ramlibacter sp.]|uniref:hypothetical protein n=1 Tax=Ramlibacter sp. TaxID=1917967 RepID=UPI002FC5982E
MCYLARHQKAMEEGAITRPGDAGQHRPRWAGAGAAALVAGLAVAALFVPPAAPPVSADESQAVAATVVSTFAPAPVVEQISITTTLDDGSPAADDSAKSAGGSCAHEL